MKKRTILAILLCALGVWTAAFAEKADFGVNLQWELSEGVLYITSPDMKKPAEMSFGDSVGNPWVNDTASIVEVQLPANLKNIAMLAFWKCSSLKTINLNIDSILTIGVSAFKDCKSLTEITIPKDMGQIESEAFYGCSSLQTVNCLPETPPVLSQNDVFSACHPALKICVPTASVAVYKQYIDANNWKLYSDRISDCKETPTALDNPSSDAKTTKLLRNGQLLILRDGETYSVTGNKVNP